MKTRILTAAAAIVLTACLVPEEFQATVQVDPAGTYSFAFSGTVAHVMAALEIKETGKLTLTDDASFRSETSAMLKDPTIKAAKYVGNGRYEMRITDNKKADEPLRALDYFHVDRDKNGVTTIRTVKLDAGMISDLRRLAIAPSGKFSVVLPKNVLVVESNADSVTKMPNSDGGIYSWMVNVSGKTPTIKYQLR